MSRTCTQCDKPGKAWSTGRAFLCDKHRRLSQMRVTAKSDGKKVPTKDELEGMIPEGMKCPDCGIEMVWSSGTNERSTTANLQHYRDGSMAIVCHTCNIRHSAMPDDTYRELGQTHKFCPECKQVLPFEKFHRRTAGKTKGAGTYCKTCWPKITKRWKLEHPEITAERNARYAEKRRKDRANAKHSNR